MSNRSIESLMTSLPGRFQRDDLNGIETTIQFDFDGDDGGKWFLTIHDQKAEITEGTADKPDATFMSGPDDFINMMSGNLEEIGWSFMQGKIVISGNLSVVWRSLALLREA